jgi:hypothetical protein
MGFKKCICSGLVFGLFGEGICAEALKHERTMPHVLHVEFEYVQHHRIIVHDSGGGVPLDDGVKKGSVGTGSWGASLIQMVPKIAASRS